MSYDSTRLLYGAHSIKANKIALRQAFSPTILPFCSVNIIPPMFNTLIHFPLIDAKMPFRDYPTQDREPNLVHKVLCNGS